MEIILFVYGLSFFILGVLVLFVRTKESAIFFARKIWLLGVFAILHAFVEWVFLYMYLYPQYEPLLSPIKFILLLLSYLFLFEFSRFIVRESFKDKRAKLHFLHTLYAAPVIYIISLSSLLTLILIHPSLDDAIAAIRYTYGFFGSLLLGIGLYYYGESLKKSEYVERLKIYFKIPGVAFICYALLAGIAVAPTHYFPGNIINTAWFLDTIGIPVQFFRALCALVITICSIKALQIFSDETHLKMMKSLRQIKRFSSDVSHELKTPLTAMKGEIEVALKEPRTNAEYQKILYSNLEDVDTLQSIVKNLLMLTYIEKESLKSKFTQQNLDDIVLNAIEDLMVVAAQKNSAFEIAALESISIMGDAILLKTVFSNLIENAIKYSPYHATLTISLTQENDKAIFCIEDEGSGIEEEKLKLIFERFYRADDSRSKQIKGFGLGLSIVQQIIEVHDGSITVKNRKPHGLEVKVALPTFQ
ncbi:sensor histidine kinase [Sulfurospirillum arsenophilum]|uniref:sensor histidine kinase n=1 Tax=Sulfurospirillum arsenophilum TaxID=56698 RepID=UPI000693C5AD|nr:HAMP domain-containing sensor histidine kinase [Sulfurospirillum arsenophilum]